jgi:hypothetical protein
MLKYHEGEEGNSQEMEKITDLVKVIFGGKIESFLIKFDSNIAGQNATQQNHHRQSGPCGRHHKSLLVQEELPRRGKKIENKIASFLWNILRIFEIKIDGIFRAFLDDFLAGFLTVSF